MCAPPQEVRFMSPGWWHSWSEASELAAEFKEEEQRHERLANVLTLLKGELHNALHALHMDTRDGIDGTEVSRASLALLLRDARSAEDAEHTNRFMQHCAVAAAGMEASSAVARACAAMVRRDMDSAMVELDAAIAMAGKPEGTASQDGASCPAAILVQRAQAVLISGPTSTNFNGQLSEAEADATAALSYDPRNHLALAVRGRARLKLRDFEGALLDLEAAQAAHPWAPIAAELQQARDAMAAKHSCFMAGDERANAGSDAAATSVFSTNPSDTFDWSQRLVRRRTRTMRRKNPL
ncbi:hypothetical protein JKP88DRAFT_228084, partial [Tribonema minus]